jgi:hypothetical protein
LGQSCITHEVLKSDKSLSKSRAKVRRTEKVQNRKPLPIHTIIAMCGVNSNQNMYVSQIQQLTHNLNESLSEPEAWNYIG